MKRSHDSPTLTNSKRTTLDRRHGAKLAALVVLAALVAFCGEAEVTLTTVPTQPPASSTPATTTREEPDRHSGGRTLDETDRDVTDPSFGTLRWTRVTGDPDSLPLGEIQVASNGELVVFERGLVWRSTDGLDWSYDVDQGLEGLPNVFVIGTWAISWAGPFENHIYETVGGRWQELDLPDPQPAEIPGLVWHVVSSLPLESGETTLVPWHAEAYVAWGDVDGLLDMDCRERDRCTPIAWTNFLRQRDVFVVTTPEHGAILAEFTMQVTKSSLVFSDVTTGEEVHRIVAESPDQAEFMAEQMKLPFSSNVEGLFHTGVWVRRSEGRFELQPVPWTRPPRSIVALPLGGFVAYQNTQRDGYTPGDARVWTSADGLSWTDHGRPAFLDEDGRHFFIEIHGTELRAQVMVDPGTMSGDEVFERYTSSDGLVWTNGDLPAEIPMFTELSDADFGTVATGWLPSGRKGFWVSVVGDSWEEVASPPGPHTSEGAGNSFAGAARDFLWLIFGDYEGTRTLWIGRFD